MPELPALADRLPGEIILASYDNDVKHRSVQRYVNASERDAFTPFPASGELGYLADTQELQFWDAFTGFWHTIAVYDTATAEFEFEVQAGSVNLPAITGEMELGSMIAEPGTEAAPTIRFQLDADTGIYHPLGIETVTIVTEGQKRFAVDNGISKVYGTAKDGSTSFIDGWADYGGGPTGFGFQMRKAVSGYVICEGLVRNSNGAPATPTSWEDVMIFPTDMRPTGTRRWRVLVGLGGGSYDEGLIELNTVGRLDLIGGLVQDNGWISMQNVMFWAGWP